MKGLLLINAYPNGEKFYRQAELIAQELIKLGVEADVRRNGEVYAMIEGDGAKTRLGDEYDFVVYLDKDKYLGKALERSGLRLFNSADAIETCDDKMSTYLALLGAGIPLATCISAPLCYTPNASVDEAFLKKVATELGFPLVVKTSYGSFGAGVRLAADMEELKTCAQTLLYTPHFYQKFIAESSGRDVRVIVVGGKAVAAMERVAKEGEFRSNVELGGEGRKIALSKEYAEAAELAAQTLKLDYCGVDLLKSNDGAIVCEVNSNAFFEGIMATTGVNVAKVYAEYIVKKMQEGQ